ncbi:MAG: hypothetical protein HRU35_02650 [Rickettsiaceae bacterium]|nr:hypothetical protein [Rickettsiaceae bacterium]
MKKRPLGRLEIPIVPYDKVPANVKPFDAVNFFNDEFSIGKVVATHEYRNKSGELLCYSVTQQCKINNLLRIVHPIRWCYNRNFRNNCWEIKGFENNEFTPIYGAEKLANNQKTVLIVESEEKADKANERFPQYNVISWLGGVRTVDQVDWSQLKGKEVVICTGRKKEEKKARKVISKELNYHNIENSYINDIKKLPSDPQQSKKGWGLVTNLLNKLKMNSIKLFTPKKEKQNSNLSRIPEEVKEKSPLITREQTSVKINGVDISKIFKKDLLDNNKIVGTHEYRDINGKLLGYSVRFKEKVTAKNKKSTEKILPISCDIQKDTNSDNWVLKPPTDNGSTPIYGAEKLSKNDKTVLLVGNEKAADKASKLFPKYNVISWYGGSKTAEKVDWTQLKEKNVIIWPDHGLNGVGLGHKISQTLEKFSSTKVYLVEVERFWLDLEKHKGWNLSQKLPDGLKLRDIQLILQKGERECGMRITPFKENENIKNNYISAKSSSNIKLKSTSNNAKSKNLRNDPPSQQNNSGRDGR